MFNDANGVTYSFTQDEPFIPAMREQWELAIPGAPEKDCQSSSAEERLAAVRQRMQAIIAKFQERAAAAAAATN
jgi:hypothetical protein